MRHSRSGILVVLLTVLRFNDVMFDHCLYFNSSALARLAEREWSAAYAPFGLTPAQGFVLRVVLASPGCLSSQIADVLGIARPTATRLIDNLCQKQLVERRQAESDGREWGVYPTRAGKALDRPINDASAQIAKTLREKVGTDLFQSAVSSMHGIRKALS
jgi:DNA-binding MarR family transcriptional regulator